MSSPPRQRGWIPGCKSLPRPKATKLSLSQISEFLHLSNYETRQACKAVGIGSKHPTSKDFNPELEYGVSNEDAARLVLWVYLFRGEKLSRRQAEPRRRRPAKSEGSSCSDESACPD